MINEDLIFPLKIRKFNVSILDVRLINFVNDHFKKEWCFCEFRQRHGGSYSHAPSRDGCHPPETRRSLNFLAKTRSLAAVP
jgi:hypothetical protein